MLLLAFFATATQDAEKDEDLYPFKKPSLLANIKFDLDSEKPVSVLIISFFSSAASSLLLNIQFFHHSLYDHHHINLNH